MFQEQDAIFKTTFQNVEVYQISNSNYPTARMYKINHLNNKIDLELYGLTIIMKTIKDNV